MQVVQDRGRVHRRILIVARLVKHRNPGPIAVKSEHDRI